MLRSETSETSETSGTRRRHGPMRWAAMLSIGLAATALAHTLCAAASARNAPEPHAAPPPHPPPTPPPKPRLTQPPLASSLAHQINLYRGSTPAGNIPKAAVDAATGPAP